MKQLDIKVRKTYYIFIGERLDYQQSAHVYKVKCIESLNYINKFKVVKVLFGDDKGYQEEAVIPLLTRLDDLALIYNSPEEPLRRAQYRTKKNIADYKKEIERLKLLL